MRLTRYLTEKRVTLNSKPEDIGMEEDGDLEEIDDYSEEELEAARDVSKLIKDNCKEFLNESEGKVLYRGYHSGIKYWEDKRVRDNRYAKDTPQEVSDAIDDEFDGNFGWRPRSEGLFCTGDAHFAGGYGTIYTVWFTDGYQYIWSDNVRDLYQEIDSDGLMSALNGDEYYWEEEYDQLYGENEDGEWLYDGEGTGESYDDDANVWVVDNVIEPNWREEFAEEISKFEEMMEYEPDTEEYQDIETWFHKKGHDPEEFNPDDQDWYEGIDYGLFEWEASMDYDDFIEEKREEAQAAMEDHLYGITNGYQDNDLPEALDSGNEIMVGPGGQKYYLVQQNISGLVWEYVHGIRGGKKDKNQMEFDFEWHPNKKVDKGVYKGERFYAGALNVSTGNIEYIITWMDLKKKGAVKGKPQGGHLALTALAERWMPRQVLKRWNQGDVAAFRIPSDAKKWDHIDWFANWDLPYKHLGATSPGSIGPKEQKQLTAMLSLQVKIVT
jgi:hypothetical protein